MTVETLASHVCGTWAPAGRAELPLLNPATEEVLALVADEPGDFATMFDFARARGGPSLRALSFAERGALLARITETLQGAREALIESAIRNGGATRSDAKFDVDGAIGTLGYYAALGKELGDARVLADGAAVQLSRSPRFWGQHLLSPRTGVAVFVNAFNFPAWGFAEKTACALLAGMPVFARPALSTAHTAHLLVQKILETRVLPEGALSLWLGSHHGLLDALDARDVLAFTGSAKTASILRRHDAVVVRSLCLNVEADSLNAAVLGPDAELGSEVMQLFLDDVVRDMTQKTGQKCTAIRRVFVPTSLIDAVQEALSERLQEITIGDPALEKVRMGPLVTKKQLEDVRTGLNLLLGETRAVFGTPGIRPELSGVPEDKGFFQPIVLLRAGSAGPSIVHRHEVFGPVATLIPYDGSPSTASEGVALGGGGLVASLYSDDRRWAEELALGIAPFHGRVYLGSSKVRDHAMGPGTVLPSCVHGGPGRAGGGEELGGLRGLHRFMQRTVLQGYRPWVEKLAGSSA